MDQYISIDIFIPKLLEWLLSRRHCNHDWQTSVVKIRAKLNEAIQDMPENKTITDLLAGTYINYFHCVKILEILKETESDSKNIFGQYSSKRMKDWQEIINLYRKNNVYLAEAADLLINTVKFEVPTIKKQIAKQKQLENEFVKKESDSIKSSASAKNELNAFLNELGLAGKTSNFRECLFNSAKQLYTINEKAASGMKTLLPAVDHYVSFTKVSQPNQTVDLGLIKYLAEKGNTTTYEWQKGVKPTKIVLPTLIADEQVTEESNEYTIDWGYDATDTDIAQIEIIDSGVVKEEDNSKPEKVDENEIVAEGQLALSVLDNASFRTNVINELLEVQMFLKARLFESEKEGGGIDSIMESTSDIKKMSSAVEKVLNSLTNTTTQHYFNILYYPRYLEDILQKIEAKESAIERCAAITAMSKERAVEARQEAANLTKKAQIIVKKSRELQTEISKDISQKYNGREVNLMGGATVS